MSTIQVDRIIPYQSSSVTIEGDVTVLGAATTGSNTFTGDQNIQGTITASIAEGFALVGGVGNVSTLVATSSFGQALPEGVVSGSAQISSLGFATTGTNTFVGNQTITGAVSISGSAGVDLNVVGAIQVTGSEAGVNTNISTLSTVITSGSNNSFLSAILFSNVDTSGGNVRLIGLYANPEKVNAALAGKVQPSLVGVNSSFAPYQVLELQSHGNYTDGTAGFKVPLEVTGSVSISSVLQLAGQDPLPAGGVGQLAVSSSGDLYYHNGVDWQLK